MAEKVNREELQRLLNTHGKNPDLVPRAMKLLEPFFAIVKECTYRLTPLGDLNLNEIAKVVAQATDKGVSKVIPVSAFQLFARPDWMAADSNWLSLENRLWKRLGVRVSLGVSLQDSLRDSLGVGLGSSLGYSLLVSLENSLGVSLENILWNSFRNGLYGNLVDTLFLFLGFTLLGDTEKMERLEPLIRLLPKCIPLGEEKYEPGVWLVMVA